MLRAEFGQDRVGLERNETKCRSARLRVRPSPGSGDVLGGRARPWEEGRGAAFGVAGFSGSPGALEQPRQPTLGGSPGCGQVLPGAGLRGCGLGEGSGRPGGGQGEGWQRLALPV